MNLTTFDNFDSNLSISTILEISKKVEELLDDMEYSNSEMLVTREHIKHNLSQLIKSSNSLLSRRENLIIRACSNRRNKNYDYLNHI